MRRCARLVLAVLSLAAAAEAGAQPTAWSAQRVVIPSPQGPYRFWLRVFDVGTGDTLVTFDAPPGVVLGQGELTPDGRFYLLATNLGVARFATNPPAFDRMLAAPGPVTGLWVPPTGTTVYASGAFGRALIDWQSGATISSGCCAPTDMVFTPDGSRRIEYVLSGISPSIQSVFTAFDTATNTVQWSRTFTGFVSSVAASATHVALNHGGEAVVLNLSGAEVNRLPYFISGMRWRGDAVVGYRVLPGGSGMPSVARLASYQMPTMSETVILDHPLTPWAGRPEPVALHLSVEGRYAYWLTFVSVMGITVSSTSYVVVDLDTARTVGSGFLGSQNQTALALEATAQCVLSVPDGLTAPAEGGVVDVPVVPSSNCRPWSAPGAMNPGPHTGPVTIREPLSPNADAQPTTSAPRIGGTVARIVQEAGPPAAPTLRGTVEGNRVRLSWEPGIGAGITGFEIRGALVGHTPVTVLTTEGSARDWTSPALGTGSYLVEVAARNRAGTGIASNAFRFSIGVSTPPDAPTGLHAAVADDQVTLWWSPPASAPAPSSYVVEAARAGDTTFAAVARTSDTFLRVTRAPAGSWQVRVRAATAGGAGPPSMAVAVTPAACTAPPGAPRTPWTLATYPSFTLQWVAPASGAVEQYVVEVGSALGRRDLGQVAVGGDRTSVVVPYGSGNTRAFARVRAVNACGESGPSADIMVQLP